MLHANSFFALAREVQQQLEDVDEVQVERECPEHGELLLRFSVEILGIPLLNRLGIPCGQPDEDEDADDGDYKLERARRKEEVTKLAITTPIRPMIRKEPNCERSRLVV